MLERLSPPVPHTPIEVPIGGASFPAPFPSKLEFNPASHGTWNIVHIGMNVPESQQIYVCAINCMRGVVLTAAEMNASDRFSFVLLREEDLVEGTVEDITIEGVADVIRRLPRRPPAVCLFTVCTHHFLGCDLNRIYRELERAFPDIDFIRGYMDPIMQKESPSPDLKLRRDMYAVLPALPVRRKHAAILGHNISLYDDSDLFAWLDHLGWTWEQMPDCATYEEYKSMGAAELFLSCVPNGKAAVENLARRLGRQALYLPMTFSYDEIEAQYRELARVCASGQMPVPADWDGDHLAASGDSDFPSTSWESRYFAENRALCDREADLTRVYLNGAPIQIDYTAHPRPLGLARYLLERGFCVEKVYLNGISGEEKKDFDWLVQHHPGLILASSILPACRVTPRANDRRILAIGQQAAWFNSTGHFVNIVEGADMQGFDGIRQMLALMRDAWEYEKDTRDLIPRKGLGCASCI